MLAEHLTFSLANMLTHETINAPEFTIVLTGMVISLIAMELGAFVQIHLRREKIMRHIMTRLIVGIVWLIAAVANCVQGSYLFAGGYAVLGITFLLSAYMGWKKEKDKRG